MGGRQASFSVLVLAVVALLAAPASAQQGTLQMRVADAETSQSLQQAQISVVGTGTGGLTDNTGQLRLSVPAGTYSIVAELIGFVTARVDGVRVSSGETVQVSMSMTSTALFLNGIQVTVTPGQNQKRNDAPASVQIVPPERIDAIVATTPVDYVKAVPGVDVVQTGLTQSNTVARGFNNVFSGTLLVLTDNRWARVPSLRLNSYNMIPATPLDIERVEVVLGPASALYGPNSANGVMHLITTSPIDYPGTKLSIMGGERSVFQGVFRQAWRLSETTGLKVSGQYFRGSDFEFEDSEEVKAAARPGANPKVGARDYDAERFGGEIRFDVRPWDDGEINFTYGLNQLGSSIELTGIGAGQAVDWKYQFGQVRLSKGGFFAQAFMNTSDAGDTYLLRTGQSIVDESRVIAGQAQYAYSVGTDLNFVSGLDLSRTIPRTGGTITGEFEDSDETDEIGGYTQATLTLSEKFDLVGALRVDKHEHLEDPVYSPRAALVFKPEVGHTLRATYNRAFSTPTTNNLFLDIVASRNPFGTGADVRTVGVPSTGFTWTQSCQGGIGSLCMVSPFVPGGRIPAAASPAFWNGLVQGLGQAVPSLAPLVPLLLNPGSQPGDPALAGALLRFNQELSAAGAFPYVADTGPEPIGRMRPTITNSYEIGYKSLIRSKLALSVDVYRNDVTDFVGPLRVETPTVHYSLATVGQYVGKRLAPAIQGGLVSQAQVQLIVGSLAAIPLGAVAPDQRSTPDLLLTYRNFGDVDFYGADVGFEFLANSTWSFNGSFSWVSEECFDFDDDGGCTSPRDIALNAPTTKGSFGARFNDEVSGFSADARLRFSDAFAMNSGVYIGNVDSYAVVDANVGYKLPWASGAKVSLTVHNLFDNLHQEFIGAPEMGRLALLKLQYEFGGY